MDFEPPSIRVTDAAAITGFADLLIRKLIKTDGLSAVRVSRSIFIAYRHFKAFRGRHRQNETWSQKLVNLRWPNPSRRAM